MINPVRRIVTGHDSKGKSIFVSIGEPPQFHPRARLGSDLYEIWNTAGAPALLAAEPPAEPNLRPLSVPPDPRGSIIRIVDYQPGNHRRLPPRADNRHPGMHRTRTIDYGIMLHGEMYLLLDDSEVKLLPGDVVIQRGTDHAWENRSERIARMAFVLIDAEFSEELMSAIPDMELTTFPFSQQPCAEREAGNV